VIEETTIINKESASTTVEEQEMDVIIENNRSDFESAKRQKSM